MNVQGVCERERERKKCKLLFFRIRDFLFFSVNLNRQQYNKNFRNLTPLTLFSLYNQKMLKENGKNNYILNRLIHSFIHWLF